MGIPRFEVRDCETELGPARWVSIVLGDGPCTPDEFYAGVQSIEAQLTPPPRTGVVFDGRGPVWGYAMLLHAAHPSAWVGTHDPRLGVVVVQSHTPGITPGREFPRPVVAE